MRTFLITLFLTLLVVDVRTGASAEPVIHEIESAVDHNHCTTRQFQHMTFNHEGVWFVFYSDGKDFRYQTSADKGITWRRAAEPVAQAPNGSTSFDVLRIGDHVYVSHAHYPRGRYDVKAPYARDPKRRNEYPHEGRIKRGRIEGASIQWLEDSNPGFTPDYSNLVHDTGGYFWIFTRESGQGVVHRSGKPNDISTWLSRLVCMPVQGRHAMDAAALDDGNLYVASLLTTDGKLYGNFFDGISWHEQPMLIADDVTTVAGDDRRLAMEFDPTSQRLHLVYVDAESVLRYRCLRSPYGQKDWRPNLSNPGQKLAAGVFTCALSIESSQSPNGLVITYGLEKRVGRDQRERTGELYARTFDGISWQGRPILVSEAETFHNWYPNVNRDACDGLCVMYSRSLNNARLQKPLAVMVSLVDVVAVDVGADGTKP